MTAMATTTMTNDDDDGDGATGDTALRFGWGV